MKLLTDLTMEELMKLLFEHSSDYELNKINLSTDKPDKALIEADMAEIQKRKGWTTQFSL